MHWLLPQGIEDLLPQEAATLERIRGILLQLFGNWGYQLVIPPIVEHTDTLLDGLGSDLENQTFKLTDPISGRTLGIRADITPQVARIDACYMPQETPARLCYLDNTLSAFSGSLHSTRNPLQVGADLYGHSGIQSDTEVILLMMSALELLGVNSICLNLGQVGIYRGLAAQAKLSREQERDLFELLQKKSRASVLEMLSQLNISDAQKAYFLGLLNLHGGREVLQIAKQILRGSGDKVSQAIENLTAIADEIEKFLPGVNLYFDLAELGGYHYHTGVVFAAYSEGFGQAIAIGGRYDGAKGDTGHQRPATGFSADVKQLAPLSSLPQTPIQKLVAVPWDDESELQARIIELRDTGTRIINRLPGQLKLDEAVTHVLEKEHGQWLVKPI